MPQAMTPLDKQLGVLDAGRAQLEKQTLGFHYGEVSAELAKVWNFPQPLIDALRDIPAPLAAAEFSEPAAWVHLGAWRARCDVLGLSDEAQLASYPTDVAKRLRVDPDWMQALSTEASDVTPPVMPPLLELTQGLEAMFE